MTDSKQLQKRVNGFKKDLIKLLEKYDVGLFATLDQKCMVEFYAGEGSGFYETIRMIADQDEDIQSNPNMYNYEYD